LLRRRNISLRNFRFTISLNFYFVHFQNVPALNYVLASSKPLSFRLCGVENLTRKRWEDIFAYLMLFSSNIKRTLFCSAQKKTECVIISREYTFPRQQSATAVSITKKKPAYLVSAPRYFWTSDFFLLSTSKQGDTPKRFNITLLLFCKR
jgi:hypothetical protein